MKWSNSKQFEKAPAGSHLARCYMVVDLGTQPRAFQGVTHLERQVRLAFELPTEKMEGLYDDKSKGRPFSVGQNCKQSLHPKANLRKLLVGWRGRDFKDAAEVEAFDPKKLVGLPVRINLVESGEYMNIASLAPVGKAEKMPKAINKPVYLSLDPEEFDKAVYDSLHKGMQDKIAASPEYKAMFGGDDGASQDDADPTGEGAAQAAANDAAADSDNVPF